MASLSKRSPQRIGDAHPADQPANNGTAGRPQRYLDFQRQYDLKPARCQRITVSGRTIASASYILGNSRQTPPNIGRSIEMKGVSRDGVRRSTLICCRKTRTSASSATRDRSRSITIPKISLHKSNIEQLPDSRSSASRMAFATGTAHHKHRDRLCALNHHHLPLR
jgi:hypothetical protein